MITAMATLVALTLGFAAALVVATQAPAAASCVGPQISVDEIQHVTGGPLTVRGEHFGTACNDTGGPGPVLGEPATGINISLKTTGDEFPLGSVDADCDYRFVVIATVPNHATIGQADIVMTSEGRPGLSVPIEIVRGAVPPVVTTSSTTIVDDQLFDCRGGTLGGRNVAKMLITIVVILALGAVTAIAVHHGRKRTNRPGRSPSR